MVESTLTMYQTKMMVAHAMQLEFMPTEAKRLVDSLGDALAEYIEYANYEQLKFMAICFDFRRLFVDCDLSGVGLSESGESILLPFAREEKKKEDAEKNDEDPPVLRCI